MARSHPDEGAPEFSRIVAIDDIGEDETVIELRASDDECTALAERFGLAAIGSLSATVRLRRSAGGRVGLRAALRGEATQTCVVTLEPIDNRVEENVDIEFEPRSDDAADVAYDPSSDREPLADDSLDIGEILAEEFALSLDPYPRKPGVSVEIGPGGTGADGEEAPPAGPFEALAALKRKD